LIKTPRNPRPTGPLAQQPLSRQTHAPRHVGVRQTPEASASTKQLSSSSFAPPTYPSGGDVHHNLLEGGRLLSLSLCVQRDFLAALSGIGRPGARAQSGTAGTGTAGAGTGSSATAACTRRGHLYRADGGRLDVVERFSSAPPGGLCGDSGGGGGAPCRPYEGTTMYRLL